MRQWTAYGTADGVVAEQGTHDELVARGGIYAGLVATQLAGLAGSRA